MTDVYVVSTVRVAVADDAPECIHELLAYLAQNCDRVTLSDTARHLCVHGNTVTKMLKQATGKSFSQLVRDMRMARAVALLEQGGIPVEQVARLCGYENPANFYRAFRAYFGASPRSYVGSREDGGKGAAATAA